MKIATRLRVFVAKFILYFGNPWLGRRMAVRGVAVICWKGGLLDDDAVRPSVGAGCAAWGFGTWPLWTTARNPHLGNSAEAVCSFSPGCAHQHIAQNPLRPRLESRCEQHMVPAFVILSAFGYEASVARD